MTHVHAVTNSKDENVNDQSDAQEVDKGTDDGDDGDNRASHRVLVGVGLVHLSTQRIQSKTLHDLSHEARVAAESHPPEGGAWVARVKEADLPFAIVHVVVGGCSSCSIFFGIGHFKGLSFLDSSFGDGDCESEEKFGSDGVSMIS